MLNVQQSTVIQPLVDNITILQTRMQTKMTLEEPVKVEQTKGNIFKINNKKSRIFIGGLDRLTTSEMVWNYSEQFGRVMDAIIIRDRVTRQSRKFGFVEFVTHESARKMLDKNVHVLNGRTLYPQLAKPRQQGTYNKANRIFVRMLDASPNEEEVVSYFKRFGAIAQVNYIYRQGQIRNFFFMEFVHEIDARKCVQQKRHRINGIRLIIEFAKPRRQDIRSGTCELKSRRLYAIHLGRKIRQEFIRKHTEIRDIGIQRSCSRTHADSACSDINTDVNTNFRATTLAYYSEEDSDYSKEICSGGSNSDAGYTMGGAINFSVCSTDGSSVMTEESDNFYAGHVMSEPPSYSNDIVNHLSAPLDNNSVGNSLTEETIDTNVEHLSSLHEISERSLAEADNTNYQPGTHVKFPWDDDLVTLENENLTARQRHQAKSSVLAKQISYKRKESAPASVNFITSRSILKYREQLFYALFP